MCFLCRATQYRLSTRTSTSCCCFTLSGKDSYCNFYKICKDKCPFHPSILNFSFFFLVFLLRFHVCVRSLPFGQTVAKNPVYFLRMIWDLAEYANHLIRLSNKGKNFLTSSCASQKLQGKNLRNRSLETFSWLTPRPRRRSGPGHQGSERRHAVRSSRAASLSLLPARAVQASSSLQGAAAAPAPKCVWFWRIQILITVNGWCRLRVGRTADFSAPRAVRQQAPSAPFSYGFHGKFNLAVNSRKLFRLVGKTLQRPEIGLYFFLFWM